MLIVLLKLLHLLVHFIKFSVHIVPHFNQKCSCVCYIDIYPESIQKLTQTDFEFQMPAQDYVAYRTPGPPVEKTLASY